MTDRREVRRSLAEIQLELASSAPALSFVAAGGRPSIAKHSPALRASQRPGLTRDDSVQGISLNRAHTTKGKRAWLWPD